MTSNNEQNGRDPNITQQSAIPPDPRKKNYCRDYIWGICTKGASCIYTHNRDFESMKAVLKFCRDYQNKVGCIRPDCTYLHTTDEEQKAFENEGKIPEVLLERYAVLEATKSCSESSTQMMFMASYLQPPPPPRPPTSPNVINAKSSGTSSVTPIPTQVLLKRPGYHQYRGPRMLYRMPFPFKRSNRFRFPYSIPYQNNFVPKIPSPLLINGNQTSSSTPVSSAVIPDVVTSHNSPSILKSSSSPKSPVTSGSPTPADTPNESQSISACNSPAMSDGSESHESTNILLAPDATKDPNLTECHSPDIASDSQYGSSSPASNTSPITSTPSQNTVPFTHEETSSHLNELFKVDNSTVVEVMDSIQSLKDSVAQKNSALSKGRLRTNNFSQQKISFTLKAPTIPKSFTPPKSSTPSVGPIIAKMSQIQAKKFIRPKDFEPSKHIEQPNSPASLTSTPLKVNVLPENSTPEVPIISKAAMHVLNNTQQRQMITTVTPTIMNTSSPQNNSSLSDNTSLPLGYTPNIPNHHHIASGDSTPPGGPTPVTSILKDPVALKSSEILQTTVPAKDLTPLKVSETLHFHETPKDSTPILIGLPPLPVGPPPVVTQPSPMTSRVTIPTTVSTNIGAAQFVMATTPHSLKPPPPPLPVVSHVMFQPSRPPPPQQAVVNSVVHPLAQYTVPLHPNITHAAMTRTPHAMSHLTGPSPSLHCMHQTQVQGTEIQNSINNIPVPISQPASSISVSVPTPTVASLPRKESFVCDTTVPPPSLGQMSVPVKRRGELIEVGPNKTRKLDNEPCECCIEREMRIEVFNRHHDVVQAENQYKSEILYTKSEEFENRRKLLRAIVCPEIFLMLEDYIESSNTGNPQEPTPMQLLDPEMNGMQSATENIRTLPSCSGSGYNANDLNCMNLNLNVPAVHVERHNPEQILRDNISNLTTHELMTRLMNGQLSGLSMSSNPVRLPPPPGGPAVQNVVPAPIHSPVHLPDLSVPPPVHQISYYLPIATINPPPDVPQQPPVERMVLPVQNMQESFRMITNPLPTVSQNNVMYNPNVRLPYPPYHPPFP